MNIITRHLSAALRRVAVAVALIAAAAPQAQAQSDPGSSKGNPVTLEVGKTYSVKTYGNFYAVYTATATGKLTLAGPGTQDLGLYNSADFPEPPATLPGWNQAYGNDRAYTLDVAAGHSYYIGAQFVYNGGDFTLRFGTTEEPIALLDVTPAEGKVLSVADAQGITLAFSKLMTVKGQGGHYVTLTAGSKTEDCQWTPQSRYIVIDYKNTLYQLYKSGDLKEGDAVKFNLYGVCSTVNTEDKVNGDGNIELKYTVAKMPVALIPDQCQNTTGTFKSYYMQYDPTAVVILKFDGAVVPDGIKCKLMYGDVETETGGYYQENMTVKALADDMLMIDFKGKTRSREAMHITTDVKNDNFTLELKNIKSADGQYIYSPVSGYMGSVDFTYPYQEVAYNPFVEYDLFKSGAATQKFDEADAMEIYLQETGGAQMTVDKVNFDYTYQGKAAQVSMPVTETMITPVEGETDARIVKVKIPEFGTDAGSNVIVSLAGETPDGAVHADKLSHSFATDGKTAVAELAMTKATLITPANQTYDLLTAPAIAALPLGGKFNVQPNKTVGYIQYDVLHVTGDEANPDYLLNMTGMKPDASLGGLTGEIFQEWTLYKGETYKLILHCYSTEEASYFSQKPDVGVVELTFTGDSEPYVYSTVELIKPNPALLKHDSNDPDIQLASVDDDKVEVEFSAPAHINWAKINTGFGSSVDCAVENRGTQSTITLPASLMKEYTDMQLSFQCADEEGKVIRGYAGIDDESYFEMFLGLDFNKPDFTSVTPADGSVLKAIEDIRFAYDKGISVNWGQWTKAYVYNKAQEVVAESTWAEADEAAGTVQGEAKAMVLHFDKKVDATGVYTVVVPSGYFSLGNEYTTPTTSKQTVLTYTVEGVAVNPAEGKLAELPAEIVITFAKAAQVGREKPTLTDAEGKSYAVALEQTAGGTARDITARLADGKITTGGTYTLTIPAGAVLLGTSKEPCSAVSFTWTVVEAKADHDGVSVDPEDGKITAVPDYFVFTFRDYSEVSVASGKVSLLTPAGDNYSADLSDSDQNYNWLPELNMLSANFAGKYTAPLTADGDYVLTIDAGAVNDSQGAPIQRSFTFVYTVGIGSSISQMFAAEGAKVTVHTVDGRTLMTGADASAIKTLKSGLYIINGRKVIIK